MEISHQDDLSLYSFTEAARLLRRDTTTVKSWVNGYSYFLRDELKSKDSVLAPREGRSGVSFPELVELLFVREFRKVGVSLEKIRKGGITLRELWNVEHPFATRKVETNQRDLVALMENDQWISPTTGQIASSCFVDLPSQLVFDRDAVKVWAPLGKSRSVALDPHRRFGTPIDRESGVHTKALYLSWKAEDDPAFVAELFEVSTKSVLDAIEFESKFLTMK